MDYLTLPIRLQSAVNSKLERCSYEESIAQHIMLLIVSHCGEVVGKEDYGSIIWDLEFNQLVKMSDWEVAVRQSLTRTIRTYEKRLKNVVVTVSLSEIGDENKSKLSHARRKAQITVRGKIFSSELPFHFNTSIYTSPLAQ